jgi:HD-GYP domain-containing protein (c-di-GMP phosphodiesterase class II)
MITESSYHNALPEEVAIEELKINAGLQFDPELIRVFIEKVLNKPFD